MNESFFRKNGPALISTLLALVVLAVFSEARFFEFVNFDDDAYLFANARVREGLTPANVGWAFTTLDMANWQPLTWLSHMLAVTVFGVTASGHHQMNVLLHILNTMLLFHVVLALMAAGELASDHPPNPLQRGTRTGPPLKGVRGMLFPAALVAGLFAVHPLHVESVAWISERKDVLSAFFWMLTLLAYARYAVHRRWHWYLAVFMGLACALMAKPMAVTLTCVLLLLDYWPLRRIGPNGTNGTDGTDETNRGAFRVVVLEKVPLFLLSAGSCIITYIAQSRGNALAPVQQFTLKIRLANAVVSYVSYIGKMLDPRSLSAVYPHPGISLRTWQIGGAAAILVAITLFALWSARRHPYGLVGWLWYVGTLVPVIGIVQVGGQAMADRYTYIPLIGLFIIVAFGLNSAVGRFGRYGRGAAIIAATGVLAGLAVMAHGQAAYWRDSEALFRHALVLNENNSIAHNNLGTALMERGEYKEAACHFGKAMAIAPDNTDAVSNRGVALLVLGQPDEAARLFQQVVARRPNDATAYCNLGVAQIQLGNKDLAIKFLNQALQIDPECRKARQAIKMIGGAPR